VTFDPVGLRLRLDRYDREIAARRTQPHYPMPPSRTAVIPAQLPAGHLCGTPGCIGDHRGRLDVCPID
jgi:hypothetical protein